MPGKGSLRVRACYATAIFTGSMVYTSDKLLTQLHSSCLMVLSSINATSPKLASR